MSNIKKDVTTRDPNPPYADDLNALFRAYPVVTHTPDM